MRSGGCKMPDRRCQPGFSTWLLSSPYWREKIPQHMEVRMKRHIPALIFIAASLCAALPAAAGDNGCRTAPAGQWLSREAVKGRLTAIGFEIRNIEVRGKCFAVEAIVPGGQKVRMYADPVTGYVIGPIEETRQ
jgi:hypothetical protein